MALNTAQLAALKAAIIADGALNALPNNSDGDFEIARLLNLISNPAFTVWKTNVSLTDVGRGFIASDVSSLTTANTSRLQAIAMYAADGINPSQIDQREFFNDVFSVAGASGTRARLLTLWKRIATRIEALLATGTGSDAAPATMTFEGTISYSDVHAARIS